VKLFSKILFVILSVLYPLVVFSCLVIFHVPVKVFSLFVVFIALLYLLLATSGRGGEGGGLFARLKKNLRLLVSAGLLLFAALVCLATGQTLFIKVYPVLMNVVFLFTFASTLFLPPNICFRFACLAQKNLSRSHIARRVEKYCFKVTVIWCLFFILNGSAALYTVFSKSDKIWSIYNGGISYLLMGILFAVEFLVRMVVNSKMPKIAYITKFNAQSWPLEKILCYERKWSDKKYLTWNDFLIETAKIRAFITDYDKNSGRCEKWILHCEDYWHFLCTFIALLQCKKEVLLTANISPKFIDEIVNGNARAESDMQGGEKILFLTDQTEVEGKKIENAFFIPKIVEETAQPYFTRKTANGSTSSATRTEIAFTTGFGKIIGTISTTKWPPCREASIRPR
jgi:uncharacterized membrane protein